MIVTLSVGLLVAGAMGASPTLRQWQLIDNGLTVLSMDTNAPESCRVAGLAVPRNNDRFVILDGSPISFYVRPIGGEIPEWYLHRTSTEIVVVVETLYGEQLGARLPTLPGDGPPISIGGWVAIVHPAWVWQLYEPLLIAPASLLSDLSECSFGELDAHSLGVALRRLPRSPRKTAVAILNTWRILDGLASHPERTWGRAVQRRGPSYPGEAACLTMAACALYVQSWTNAAWMSDASRAPSR